MELGLAQSKINYRLHYSKCSITGSVGKSAYIYTLQIYIGSSDHFLVWMDQILEWLTLINFPAFHELWWCKATDVSA